MAIEIIFNTILGLFVVFYLVQMMQMPETGDSTDLLGAGGFPLITGLLALLVLVIITVRAIRSKTAVALPLFDMRLPAGRLLLVNICLLAGYIILLDVLGFAVSTLLYLFVAPTTFGYCKWKWLAAFSVLGAVVLVAVFGAVFYVPLPRGIGLFRELSYLVY